MQFNVSLSGTINPNVSWSLSPAMGTLNNGLYQAPSIINTQQNVTVTAASLADPTKTSSATIALVPASGIALTPSSTSLAGGQSTQFNVTIGGSPSTAVTWALAPTVGTITNGVYTAPATISSQQTIKLAVASVADPTQTAQATINLTTSASPSTSVSPSLATLSPAQTQQFISAGLGTNPAWTINPNVGNITSGGLYTAPSTVSSQSTVIVMATSAADATKSASATINLVSAVAVAVTPASISLSGGQSTQFNATVTGTGNTAVTWSLAPAAGTVVNGLYTAPAVISATQTVVLMVTSVADPSQTAQASIALAPSAPITLPIEVVGPIGNTETVTVVIPDGANLNAPQLWMQIHGLKYENKGSVQVNNSPWVPLNNTSVTLLGNAATYGGMGGGFSTLKMTLDLPPGTLVPGANTVSFMFNGPKAVGFRVLNFNFVDPNGNMLLPPSIFVQDDPNLWQPPLTSPEDIAAGQSLFQTASILHGGVPVLAHCNDCHTVDGRDLKYFNYSNKFIQYGAVISGLTAHQGDQISSYIRTLNVPNPGRPWNPPYQPGPGLDSKPVEEWAAGAGLDAVLDTDQDVLSALFPNGIQSSVFAGTGNLSVRETPIALQLPDWNSWRPQVHPMDAWGDMFLNSKFYTDYLQLRAELKPGDPVAYAKTAKSGLFMQWPGDFQVFLTENNLTPNQYPNIDPNFWTPSHIQNVESTALWAMLKSWELNQEFGLEGMAQSVFLNPGADSRAWLSRFPFNTAPHILHIPQGFPGLDNANPNTWTYMSMIWYHLQLILNNSNKQQSGDSPIDWEYTYGFIAQLASDTQTPQTGLQYIWQIKGLQTSSNGLGPDATTYPWFWEVTDQSVQVYQGPGSEAIWNGTTPAQRALLYDGEVRAFLDEVEQFKPQQFYPTWANPAVAPVRGNPFGALADRIWYAIPLLHYFGLSQALTNEFADWAQTVWPLGQWDVVKNDTCAQSTYGVTCNSYH
jgi:hypothetical protein